MSNQLFLARLLKHKTNTKAINENKFFYNRIQSGQPKDSKAFAKKSLARCKRLKKVCLQKVLQNIVSKFTTEALREFADEPFNYAESFIKWRIIFLFIRS